MIGKGGRVAAHRLPVQPRRSKQLGMRFLAAATLATLLAACTTSPRTQPQPAAPVIAAPQPVRQQGSLIGLTTHELGARFGQPVFQVREGPGLKLQWATRSCVLDAFLYPPGGAASGTLRVTYVDARRPSGDPTDPAGCIATLQRVG